MLSVRYVLKYNILSNISKYLVVGIFNVRNVVEGLDPKAPPCSCSYQNSPLHLQPHEDHKVKGNSTTFARATLSVDKIQYRTYWATYRNIGLVAWVFSMFELAWTVSPPKPVFVEEDVLNEQQNNSSQRLFSNLCSTLFRYITIYNIFEHISKYGPKASVCCMFEMSWKVFLPKLPPPSDRRSGTNSKNIKAKR